MAVEMELVSVEAPERPTRTPVVILRETGGQRLDSLDPDSFKYTITAREAKA